MQILENINHPNDVKKINPKDYEKLAGEIRKYIIQNISKTGGHLSSNLGVVELTLALHLSMDFPKDQLIWDVGHQAYTHKILTGRKKEFHSLRSIDGLSGFPKTKESDCDSFNTGHSSTSISAALGIAKARDLKGEHNKVVAVIGDGALSGGMAYEALNNAARLDSNMIIVLNDNHMSISENVGGMANYLGKLRTDILYNNMKRSLEVNIKKVPMVGSAVINKLKKSKHLLKSLVIPGMLFEDMGLTYIGPIDGHDITQLKTAFLSASKVKRAVLVHVITKKGKGYALAEQNPSLFHGVDAFDIKTGKKKKKKKESTYTDVFSETIVELGREHPEVVAISAAMPSGTGLEEFMREFPERFFDVGIAEEHAITFGAGLASQGMKPFVALYSTFLQRGYDQILHDVCISKLPVVFAIDRSGIVGKDGETHQGIFDISFLSHIPFFTLLAPKDGRELKDMLQFAYQYNGPIGIRYPRGHATEELVPYKSPIEYGKSEHIVSDPEGEIAIVAVGSMVETAVKVREHLKNSSKKVTLVNARFISPMDESMLHGLLHGHRIIVTMEENIKAGGFGEKVASFLMEHQYHGISHLNISLPNEYLEHGDVSDLKEKLGLDDLTISQKIMNRYNELCIKKTEESYNKEFL